MSSKNDLNLDEITAISNRNLIRKKKNRCRRRFLNVVIYRSAKKNSNDDDVGEFV